MHRLVAILLTASLLLGCSPNETVRDVADNSKSAMEQMNPSESADGSSVKNAEQTDPPSDSDSSHSPAELAFQKLKAESDQAESDFMTEVQNAPREEQMELYMSGGQKEEYAARFIEFATKHPKTESTYEALTIAAKNGAGDVASKALNSLAENFADDKRLVEILPNMNHGGMGMPAQRHEDFLKTLAEKSTVPVIKGGASITLYQFLSSLSELQDMIKDQPEMAESIPEESLAYLNKERGEEEFKSNLIGILDEISEKYADVKFGRQKLGDLVAEEKFVFENLSLGATAPEIDGIDLDGKPFKLSDYKGKVVMLDFWGDW